MSSVTTLIYLLVFYSSEVFLASHDESVWSTVKSQRKLLQNENRSKIRLQSFKIHGALSVLTFP